jgi:hypothetical protein
MNVHDSSGQTLPQDTPGVLPVSLTHSESLVQCLAESLAKLAHGSNQQYLPRHCDPTLEAWLSTQMSKDQFDEFRMAYEKWTGNPRTRRLIADFRVELKPRYPACVPPPVVVPLQDLPPTVAPAPPSIPAASPNDATFASPEVN